MLLCTSHREAHLRNPVPGCGNPLRSRQGSSRHKGSRGCRRQNDMTWTIRNAAEALSPRLSPDRISFARADRCDRSFLARLTQ